MDEKIQRLVNLCDDVREEEGKKIHSCFIGSEMYLGFDRHLTGNFKPMIEAFNGYREVYYSNNDLCNVTTCEGDLSIVLFDTVEAYNEDMKKAIEFYKEH